MYVLAEMLSVMLHGDVCIPVSACQQLYPSSIIFSNTQEQLHLTWNQLLARHNVNLTYNGTYHMCFQNVTESFLFLEYCDMNSGQTSEIDSAFCCNSWVEFVSRTCVNVDGGRGEQYSP